MKKLIAAITLLASFFITSPTFAYTVESGDTMTQIALDHHMSLDELADLNPQVNDLDLIYVGQTIHTPESVNSNLMNSANAAEPDQETLHIKSMAATAVKSMSTTVPNQETKYDNNSKYSNNEIDLLARLVRAEAQGESLEGKIAVACVVLNRVDSEKFPDTIKGVIYQSGQFQPVTNGAINKPADEDSIKAVNEALSSSRNLAGASLYFYNPATAQSRWLDSRPTITVIGHHVFKK